MPSASSVSLSSTVFMQRQNYMHTPTHSANVYNDKPEVDGKPARECLSLACTDRVRSNYARYDRWAIQKHNAYCPIYRMGGGITSAHKDTNMLSHTAGVFLMINKYPTYKTLLQFSASADIHCLVPMLEMRIQNHSTLHRLHSYITRHYVNGKTHCQIKQHGTDKIQQNLFSSA